MHTYEPAWQIQNFFLYLQKIYYKSMKDVSSEFQFTSSRSSGPGGQNVNKVETKIQLRFAVEASAILTDEEKELIKTKLANHLTTEGELLITAQTERSQLKNKEEAVKKFYRLLEKAFAKPKPRKASKPSKAAVQERLQFKKEKSEKKTQRQKKDWHPE